jgi:hypothetical protein
VQTIDLGMSKDLSEVPFNPRAASLFRPNGSELLAADQLAKHLSVKVGRVKRQSRAGNLPSIKTNLDKIDVAWSQLPMSSLPPLVGEAGEHSRLGAKRH